MKYVLIGLLIAVLPTLSPGGYDKTLVEIKTLDVAKEPCGVIKLRRSGNHVKVKYFASNLVAGVTVSDRYKTWSYNKNIIAYSSGTYMNSCVSEASPVGLCIDQGYIINENLAMDKLDGLMIVYATGGIVASNLKDGNLTIVDGTVRKTLDIRNNAYDKAEFLSWAKKMEATVFQTHLFVYGDKVILKDNSSQAPASRRFLAVCKLDNNDIVHYVINLPTPCAIRDGADKAYNYLKNMEDVKEITFMINLDTGCQDIFTLYDPAGQEFNSRHFQGDHRLPLSKAANMLVYYYEN